MDTTDGHILWHDCRLVADNDDLEAVSPGGAPRVGILKMETTRGDRLFISLLGSAFIHLSWLLFASGILWWALGISIIYAICVFLWV